MKILAIRGCNLASIAGEFEIDFNNAPLADAGIFAITGPTGAGKSTLLDALCLALFDKVPRLLNGSRADVGRHGEAAANLVSANDVRSILRRGTGEAWAEVDFRGVDNKRYRAKWSARTARMQPGKKLQAQEISAVDLETGQSLGSKKTEILPALEEKLGLNFEQFRRSVLLAQGDFAAFLRSSADQRSSLLERITGTEIYRQISKRAHEREGLEQSELKKLEARMGDFKPLSDEQRSELEQTLQQQNEGHFLLVKASAQAKSELDWFALLDKLVAQETNTKQVLDNAQAIFDQSIPRQSELLLVQKAWAIAPVWNQLKTSRKQQKEQQGNLTEARVAFASAVSSLTLAREKHEKAKEELAARRKDAEAAEPKLKQARKLDQSLKHRSEELNKAQTLFTQRGRESEALTVKTAELEGTKTKLTVAQSKLAQWLLNEKSAAPLAEHWSRWETEFGRLEQAGTTQTALERQLAEIGTNTNSLHKNEETIRAQSKENAKQMKAKDTALSDSEESLKQLNPYAIARELSTIRDEETLLIRQEQSLKQIQALHQSAQVLERDIESVTRDLAQAHLVHKESSAELARLNPSLEEANHAYQLIQKAAGETAESLRNNLETDIECPVCGSVEHPWAAESPAFNLLVNEQRQRFAEIEQQVQVTSKLEAQSAADIATSQKLQQAKKREQETVNATLQSAQSQWNAEYPKAPHPRVDDCASVLEQQTQANRLAISQLNDQSEQANTLRSKIEDQRKLKDTLQQQSKQREKELTELSKQYAALNSDRAALAARRDECSKVIDEARKALSGVLDETQLKQQNHQALRRSCFEKVTNWRKTNARMEAVSSQLRENAQSIAHNIKSAETAKLELAQAEETFQAATVAHQQCSDEHASLFGGEDTDSVENRLKLSLVNAESTFSTSLESQNSASAAQLTLAAKIEHLSAALSRLETDVEQNHASFQTELNAVELTEEAFKTRLSYGKDWIEQETQALTAIKSELERSHTLMTEHSRQRGVHESSSRPSNKRDACEQILCELESQLNATEEARSETRIKLGQDDQFKKQSADLQKQYTKQEAKTRVWAQMKELIGSANGGKFSRYAQSLTLDALLHHANHQLRDLAPRYQLERAPGSDLELQVVDKDMGDEVRSVNSLSGGESFLVSLALALGLASLSSQRTRVESLFIDEGFGSLDADTLDTALASLDSLQAQGRQVGIISHVPALVERIGVQIKVAAQGGGRSSVTVCDALTS